MRSIFHLYLLVLSISSTYSAKAKQGSQIVQLLGHWDAYQEMSRFLSYSVRKFGETIPCHTIIWDQNLSTAVDYMQFCTPELCVPNYSVQFDGLFTPKFTQGLKASYTQHCRYYVVLLTNTYDILQLIRFGDEFRMVDTRGKFLIWYGEEDKSFENDVIWRKLPNVVLFHYKLNRRTSSKRRSKKKVSFKILSLKWPIIPNVTNDATRVIDFWRQGRLTKDDLWFRDKTTDLRNVTLRVLTVEHPPSVIKYRSGDPGLEKIEYAGTEMEVLKELSLIMNFGFDIVDADPATKWGGVFNSSNGTEVFTGAVAKLVQDEVDMALGAFIVLKKNLEYLDMSIPIDVACTTFLTPNPLPLPRYLALILPFQTHLWGLVIFICVVFAPLGLYFMAKLRVHMNEFKLFSTRWNSVITSISIMSQVALHIWPKFWAMRLLIAWYWIFCLLISLAYRCAMVSFLTIPLLERPIDNLKQLAGSGLRVGGWGPGLMTLFTQQARSENNKDDEAKMYLSSKYEMLGSHDEGIALVSERKLAMYDNVRFLKFMARTRNLSTKGAGGPTMRTMKQCILPVHLGIAYQKNSPIAPTINKHVRRFQESGLMKKWSQRLIAITKRYYKKKEENNNGEEEEEEDKSEDSEAEIAPDAGPASKQRKQRVLSRSDLQGAFYFITFGMILSVIVFFGEIGIKFYHRHKLEGVLILKHQAGRIPTFPLAKTLKLKPLGSHSQRKDDEKDIFSRITERTLQIKTQRELTSILREMGVVPTRKEAFKSSLRRKWKMLKRFFYSVKGENLFPYLE